MGVQVIAIQPLMQNLATALAKTWGMRELIIGTQIGGRDEPLMLGVIGPTANTVILRLDAGLAPDFWEFAGHVRTVTAEALANKTLPFDEAVADTRFGPDGSVMVCGGAPDTAGVDCETWW